MEFLSKIVEVIVGTAWGYAVIVFWIVIGTGVMLATHPRMFREWRAEGRERERRAKANRDMEEFARNYKPKTQKKPQP